MAKKNSSNVNRSNNNVVYPVALPCVLSIDDIAFESDDVLYDHADDLNAARNRVVDAELDALPWEVEICYLQRELQIRKNRRDLHVKYLADLAQQNRASANLDYMYPAMNLDENLRFVKAVDGDFGGRRGDLS